MQRRFVGEGCAAERRQKKRSGAHLAYDLAVLGLVADVQLPLQR
jgi:hypothetical protein